MSEELIGYIVRIAPASLSLLVFLLAVPKKLKLLRIFAFILLFILFRDALTPEGLWTITSSLELRFISQPLTLWLLAFASVGVVVISHFTIASLRDSKMWVKKAPGAAVFAGFVGGILIAVLPYAFGVMTSRVSLPRPQGLGLIGSIAALAFLGNLLEEVLFRGHLQNYFIESGVQPRRTVFLSGAMFALCHSFLAFTVTPVGWPILLFTFYEGLLCAFLRYKNGLLSSVLAHGTGLFLILTGALG